MDKTATLQSCLDTAVLPLTPAILSAHSFIDPGGGLPHFAALVSKHANRAVKVAFLGGSITHMKGWRELVMDYLIKRYTQTQFEFLDAGIPSLGSVPHAFRFKKDVLESMTPDLLFIESAVNDAVNGTPIIEQKRALEGIIRHAHQANPQMDMVLMAFADEMKNAAYARGSVPPSVQIHQRVAAHYQLSFINLAKEVYTRIHQGEFNWEKDFKGLHPAPFGQQIYFEAIKSLLDGQIAQADQKQAAFKLKAFPKAMQSQNYSQGHYVDITRASALLGFQLVKDWTPADKVNTRPGFVHLPVLEGGKPGDELVLKFTGTAVGIAVLSGPDCGRISYQIDGGAFKTMDLYTHWSSNLYLPWYELLGDGLKSEPHVLKLIIAPSNSSLVSRKSSKQKNGAPYQNPAAEPRTTVRIVHFLVNGPRS